MGGLSYLVRTKQEAAQSMQLVT